MGADACASASAAPSPASESPTGAKQPSPAADRAPEQEAAAVEADEPAAKPRAAAEDSSDDAGSYSGDSDDWKSSSCESRPSSTRFSLVAIPGKVRDSIFARRAPRKKKPARRSAGPGGKPAAASLSPVRRHSSLPSLTPFAAFRRRQPEPDSVEKFKHFWDEKLRSSKDRITSLGKAGAGAHFDPASDVFHLLLQLYAHQDVIEDLYSSYEMNADEFEFYIPQLCTFLIHGNYAKQHQLECFVMTRSGDSLTFAHRLTWFLRSFCDDARRYQSEYLSVTASPDQENSDLLTAIELRAGVPALLLNNGLSIEEVSRPANLRRRRSIVFPIDQELDPTALASDETFAGHLLTMQQSVVDEARTEEGNSQQISLYKQTPDFVDALTGLADRLIPVARADRNEELRNGLREIQEQLLPSDVLYLPIGNSYHRVKAIHADECFTFSTKERVPYFLCVEVLDYAVASSQTTKKARHARGFSLKLGFNKKSPSSNVSNASPSSASSYAEFEHDGDDSVVLLTPKNPRVTLAQIIEDEQAAELRASLRQRESLDVEAQALGHDRSLTPASVCEPLDGEVGDDEKEDIKTRATQFADESAAEEEILQKSTDEQLERMGQWSQPRARRDSKTHSSSASARSGGQFDSFYSSWFSRKTRREHGDDDTSNTTVTADSASIEREQAEQVTGSTSPNTAEELPARTEEDTAPVDGISNIDAASESEMAAKPVSGSRSWLPWRKAGSSPPVLPDTAPTTSKAVIDIAEKATTPDLFGEAAPASSSASLVDADTTSDAGSAVIIDANDAVPEATDFGEGDVGPIADIPHGTPSTQTESPGIFGWLFRRNKASGKVGDEDVNAEVVDPAGGELVEHSGASDETEHSSTPSESEPTEAEQPAVEPVTENGDEDDNQADDKSMATAMQAAETGKPFTFWFARRSKQGPSNQKDGTSSTLADSETADPLIVPESTNCEVIVDLVDGISVVAAEEEEKPAERLEPVLTRSRDLSLSLDFTDADAWKEKFDLEDGLSDAYLTEDEHGDARENEDEDREPEIPANLEVPDEEEKPMIVFRERWSEKEARIRQQSEFGDHPGWRLLSVIVKSNDDLRQEQFAAQLIAQCDRIFREYALPLSLRPYNVIATSATTGLIEAVPDTVSLDSLKRNDPDYTTLLDFYTRLHGPKDSIGFSRARRNFVESLAAYSIVCYVFQIKDRHNGNILLDTDGHVIHIDFGFLLTNSPGSNLNFERAPFKLTDEFVELMGGPRSSTFRYFRSLCIRAYLALRRDMEKIVLMVEMMLVGNSDLPCFAGGKKAVIDGLRTRLKPGARTSTCQLFVNQLIDQSINNWRTRWYDKYQRAALGIM